MAIGLVALIVLALMRLGLIPSPVRPPQSDLNSFDVAAPSPTVGGATATPDPAKAAPERATASTAAPPPPPPPLPPIPRPADTPALACPDILILRGDQFARSDIGRIPGTARGAGEAATGDTDTASAYGPGEGPGGERLFNAQWHVEPTNAQLTGYLPPTGAPPGSWATIACRTIERYEVENCRALSESPVGSGLARAMRQAAWQFRVRPPRIGGRPQIGTWVRIRITFDTRPD
jgi:protein TonB